MKKTSLLFCLLTLLAGGASQAASAQPNIIVLLIDDMGYECIGANGCTSYKTPVIDKLAATGVRFEHCSAQPVCTPTRVQMMTGIYNVRNYTDFGEMEPKNVTFANILKQAGYATCISGKWQLGEDVNLPNLLSLLHDDAGARAVRRHAEQQGLRHETAAGPEVGRRQPS